MIRRRTRAAALAAVIALGASACSLSDDETTQAADRLPGPYELPQGNERVDLDPADFSIRIDNPYWPMAPGTTWIYRETDAEGATQRVEVTVTNQTKVIAGIEARVVHDVVSQDGETIEDTFDWYAQDSGGNIWYLGEDTKEYKGGKVVSTAGSWEAGVNGAQAGIAIPAEPKAGMAYRQEYYAGEAEDNARVLSTDEFVEVPAGSYRDLLMTRETTPLEPSILEYKFYAKGVGLVLAVQVSGGASREELIRVRKTG